MGIIRLKKDNAGNAAAQTAVSEEANAVRAERQYESLPQGALFENKNRETAYQNVFRFNNGTTRQFISGAPKNYKSAKTNVYEKIRTRLNKNADGDFECLENVFDTKFYAAAGNEKIYLMKKDGCEVGLTARSIKGGNIPEELLEDDKGNKVILKQVREGVDIEYELESNRIKENIIIRERQENYVFDFGIDLTNLNVSIADDYRSIALKSKENGNTIFKIPSPVMYDANGEYSDEVSYEISEEEGGMSIKVVADSDYFNAPERAFPVIIDPQIIVEADEISSYKVYRKTRGSSGYTYNWIETTSQYIRVSRSATYDYRTIIKIDKSQIGLLKSTINNVKLNLKKYSVTQSGYILANGSKVYMSTGNLSIDITNSFKSCSDTSEFSVTIEPNTAYVNGQFYASGNNAPELEIEYLGNNDKPLIKRFSLAGIATGMFNAGTGEIVTRFESVSASDLSINYGISHIYKHNADEQSENLGLGDDFRLNLHERFVKNDAGYDYTDPSGTKVAFIEAYYYLDDDNAKQYVLENEVVAGVDGRLTCEVDGKTFEVQVEYQSSTGLKAIAKLENVKNAELVEQRSDELKQLENQVQSYENVLNDYVLINMGSREISYNQPISESKYNAIKNSSYCCLALSHAEALQYKSLKEQRAAVQEESMTNYVPGLKVDNTLEKKDDNDDEYTQLFSLENSFAVLNNQLIEYLDQREKNDELRSKIDSGIQNIISADLFYDINQEEQFKFYQNKSEKTTFGTDLVDMLYQRNLLIKQIEETKASINLQIEQLDDQIALIESKREQQLKQFNNYYKEYVNLKYQLDQMQKHIPENYLTDGTLYKGFNKYGDLVTIFDSYGNALNVEYADNQETTRRIKRVYDGENKAIEFEYNSDGRLSGITDTRGRTIRFSYNAKTIINGMFANSESNRLGKVEFSDGRIIEFSYTRDDTNGKYEIYEVLSGEKQKTKLSYVSGKLLSVYDYSRVSSIKNGDSVENENGLQKGYCTINYVELTTTITDQDGNKEKYVFNGDEFVTEALTEKGGKVVSAEIYDYVPYERNNIQYAKKDTLNKYALTSFNFVAGDTVNTTLNAFNNPVTSVTNARQLNASGTNTQTTVAYTYNSDQKVTEEKTTIVYANRTEPVISYKKYWYNAFGLVVRTESYVDGEENTTGRSIEETVYDEKGNVVKSFTYNSLDSGSKFYTESEYAEDGSVTADMDATGEYKTKYEYVPGTNIVRTEVYPNGSKLSYGHDLSDTVTSITQSTEEGEENSNQTIYTCGKATEIRSGNNVVTYEYDHKGRITKVGLNGTENYVTYQYGDEATISTQYYTNVPGRTFSANYLQRGDADTASSVYKATDKRGNVLRESLLAGYVDYKYGDRDLLTEVYDMLGGTETYEYDGLDRVATYTQGSNYTESYEYDDYGSVSKVTQSRGGVPRIYEYSYRETAGRELESITVVKETEAGEVDKGKIKPKRDVNGRNKGKEIEWNGEKIGEEYIVYRKVGDHATNMPASMYYGDRNTGAYGMTENVRYAYDGMGNITKVYENGEMKIRYEYDALNRLIREDNKDLKRTEVYAYDNNGNRISSRRYGYTQCRTEELEEKEAEEKEIYSYDGDRLIGRIREENGQKEEKICVYDNLGNPTKYLVTKDTVSNNVRWSETRQLSYYGGTSFSYDVRGKRLQKGTKNYSYDSEGRLLKQGEELEFLYDDKGVVGFVNAEGTYFYRKDILGNITGILDSDGKIVVRYKYDAWGNHVVLNPDGSENESSTFIGNINPFRYRGYYYDVETGLYYLKTRYYDPETGRFITIDDVSYLAPDTINGLNLYAYCGNNPIKYIDSFGCLPFAGIYNQVYSQYILMGFDSKWWGRMTISSSTTLEQLGEKGFFYAFSSINIHNAKMSWGVGINMWEWLGIKLSIDSGGNLGISANITPWVHFGVSIGMEGITISAGITVENTSYDFSIGIGLAPLLIIGGIAATILSGGQLVPAILSFFAGIFL